MFEDRLVSWTVKLKHHQNFSSEYFFINLETLIYISGKRYDSNSIDLTKGKSGYYLLFLVIARKKLQFIIQTAEPRSYQIFMNKQYM